MGELLLERLLFEGQFSNLREQHQPISVFSCVILQHKELCNHGNIRRVL